MSPRQSDLWVDFSYTKPPLSTLLKYAGIIGYVSSNSSKNLPRTLAHQVVAGGRRVLLVWQQGGTGPLGGYAQGVKDATKANRQADALGYPQDIVILYAVDFDPTSAQMATVLAYFSGVLSVARRPAGPYGGYRTIDALFRAFGPRLALYWQTKAWSGGRVHPQSHLLQEPGAPYYGTPAVDENQVLKPFRAWGDRPAEPEPPKPAEPTGPLAAPAAAIAWHYSPAAGE